MKYHSALKRNEILIIATIWMNLENMRKRYKADRHKKANITLFVI